jgi:hypothetical protein
MYKIKLLFKWYKNYTILVIKSLNLCDFLAFGFKLKSGVFNTKKKKYSYIPLDMFYTFIL